MNFYGTSRKALLFPFLAMAAVMSGGDIDTRIKNPGTNHEDPDWVIEDAKDRAKAKRLRRCQRNLRNGL